MVALPSVVTIRPTKKVFDIKPFDTMFYIEGVNGLFFNIPSGAYNYVKDVLGGEPRFNPDDLTDNGHFIDGVFHEHLGEHRREIQSFHMFEGDTKNVEYATKLRTIYEDFLTLNEDYQSNQENWVVAYNWLLNHPAFYHQVESPVDYWVTDCGLDGLVIHPYATAGYGHVSLSHREWMNGVQRTPDGSKTMVSRCVQSSVSPIFLRVTGKTFEEAYILLAKNVDLFYSIDGVLKDEN